MSNTFSLRERLRRSFRRSGSSTATSSGSQSTPTRKLTTRRSSIFDLLFLLRRGSSARSGSPKGHKAPVDKQGEQEAFVPVDGEVEDDRQLSREKLLEKIREKKAVIEKLRCQPWPMRRKRRTLKLAQKYLQRHESKVSKTHLLKEELTKKWKKCQRWLANVFIYLIPWEAKIKAIESHFGSVVSSYFTFLRWIFWVNVIMMLFMVSFVVVPECLADSFPDEERRTDNDTMKRKRIDPEEQASADYLQTIWDYKGYLTVSPLFYGYYSNKMYILKRIKYQLPLAYFLVNLFTLGYSFFAILRRMAANTRLSKLTGGKTEQYVFAWKMFTGWDYTIGNAETAANTVMANANKFRESIMEFKIKQKEKFAWILFMMRILANILILSMIATSTYVVNHVVEVSHKKENPTAFEQNQVAIVVSFITLVFPNFFELISKGLERFHPRTALRVHLGRILALYLLNFYTLIFALFTNITRIAKTADDDINTTSVPRSAAFSMDRDTFLDMLRNSSHDRFPRSLFESNDTTVMDVLEPILNSTILVFTNLTSTLTDTLPTLVQTGSYIGNASAVSVTAASTAVTVTAASASIPPLIHFLNLISRRTTVSNEDSRDSTSNYDSSIRTIRQSERGKDSYYRYRTMSGRQRTTTTLPSTTISSVTGPLLWTTLHPEAGAVGVSEANAFLTENISEWMRNNTNDLETLWGLIGGKPPFPNFTAPRTTQLGSPPPEPGQSGNVTRGAIGSGAPERRVDPGGTSTAGPSGIVTKAIVRGPGREPEVPVRARADKLSIRERRLQCWETWVGQEIAKLITMDLVMTIAAILIIDFFRGLWVRYCNRWWCWNLETVFPEYGEFKVAENVLHIINNQGMIWLGLFFAPMLPVMNLIKLIIIMYIRGWAVVTCNVPATQVFRASRSNNFYLLLLLLMLFLCTLPVGYVIAKLEPSGTCGPFSYNEHFYSVITNRLEDGVPKYIYENIAHLASPGIVIPVLVLLALIIYFLVSLIRGLREANQDLQKQLVHERTEEKRKIYQLAGGGKSPKGPTGRSSSGLPETKKVDLGHLPEKEKIRREAWRTKVPLSDDESPVRASDNDFSTRSPSSIDTASPGPKPGYPDYPAPPPAMTSSTSSHYMPSLRSLPEEANAAVSEMEETGDDEKRKLLNKARSGVNKTKSNEDNASRSSLENARAVDKRQNHWAPLSLGLLQRQSPQDPTVTTPLLAPAAPVSRSSSASSSRSHSPVTHPIRTTAQVTPMPRFPTAAEMTQDATPINDSWPTSNYNYPTPMSPSVASLSGQSPYADLTSKTIAQMLSPTQFSPTTFQEFTVASPKSKGRPIKALKVISDTHLPLSEIRSPRTQANLLIHTTSDVFIHMSDSENEKYPSDSGRATMTGSGDTPVSRPQRLRIMYGADTDTGAESEMETFARDRLMADNDRRESMPDNKKDRETFPKPMSSDFVPWPEPAPKSILKHVGPPGRGVGTDDGADTLSPPMSPRRRFTVSMSPNRAGMADSTTSGFTTDSEDGNSSTKKRYIIRQTPSPSPKLRRAYIETATAPTKLAVVSEVTALPRLATKTASKSNVSTVPSTAFDERRLWASNIENNNVPYAQNRPTRAEYPSRSRMVESHSANTPLYLANMPAQDNSSLTRRASANKTGQTKSNRYPSKETII